MCTRTVLLIYAEIFEMGDRILDRILSRMQSPASGHRTPTTDPLFVAALARMAPTASRRTAGERRGHKDRQEQRMSIRHRVRRG